RTISSSIIFRMSGTTSILPKPTKSASVVSTRRGERRRWDPASRFWGVAMGEPFENSDACQTARTLTTLDARRQSLSRPMSSYHLDHLEYLETEAIHVMREVVAEFERPALLFSGGKDSICLLRLAEKAFRPSDIPMPLLNVDTGHHFPELNEFR